jgi:hypothetical protein
MKHVVDNFSFLLLIDDFVLRYDFFDLFTVVKILLLSTHVLFKSRSTGKNYQFVILPPGKRNIVNDQDFSLICILNTQ